MNFGPLSPRKTLNYTKIQLSLLYLKSSSEFKRQRSSGEEGTKPNPGGIPYLQAVPPWARGQAVRCPSKPQSLNLLSTGGEECAEAA